MVTRRHTNLLWGVVALAVALLVLLSGLNLLPAGIYDVLARAWPVLIVLLGLGVLLRGRVPLGSLIALVLSLVLVVGIAAVAFSTRSAQLRTDNEQTIVQPIGENIDLLQVRVRLQTTDAELLQTLSDDRQVTGNFTGSTESQFSATYSEEGATGTLSIEEAGSGAFPLLAAVGRGVMRLELPANVPLDVSFVSANGDVTLNMGGLSLERLNVELADGDVLVTLPEYDPLYSEDDAILGTLVARNGDLTVSIPEAAAAQLSLGLGTTVPQYDTEIYNFLVGDILEAKLIESADIVLRYTLEARRGQIRVESVP